MFKAFQSGQPALIGETAYEIEQTYEIRLGRLVLIKV